jgi:formylglycine-generating enzyme required for sulfatase activity
MTVTKAMKNLAPCALVMLAAAAAAGKPPCGRTYTNFLGMEFVRIEPGEFRMGQLETIIPEVLPVIEGGDRGGRFDLLAEGDYDERPVHRVRITGPFYMGATEVTNRQYGIFDPAHRNRRGKHGLSSEDDEAVCFVSWYDADAFCRWLSDKEGLPCRLPTEAEWEYACRAGTTTNYYTGDMLPESFLKQANNEQIPRSGTAYFVGKTAPNAWGLHDMHGNVEEWCGDWYGPYTGRTQKDPVGYACGDFKVTRGGSCGTYAYFLRSANRMGMLPAERNWAIGFRVVIGEPPRTRPLEPPPPAAYQRNVEDRTQQEVLSGPDPGVPYFEGPKNFVRIPRQAIGPLFAGHNHNPAVCEAPNGDLLACWYTCVSERDREMGQGGSRLRKGNVQWDEASPFWDVPDRNDHAPVLWYDGADTVYHFTTYSPLAGYGLLAVAMRTSTDSGRTWSRARIIIPDHFPPEDIWGGHQLSEPAFRMNDGAIAITTDGFPTLWISRDEGLTWQGCGGTIAGNHPGVAQLADGRLVGFYRGNEVEYKEVLTQVQDYYGRPYTHKARKWRMPVCYSSDGGRTWEKTPSPFPGVDGGQRLVLMRLKEGPLLLASLANRGLIITDSSGTKREVRGLYAALSEDGGRTWPYVRLLTDDGPGRDGECTNGGKYALSASSSTYRGYCAGCQGRNGVIHIISSFEHFAFNLAWLKTPPPPLRYPPVRVKAAVETFTGPEFDLAGWEPYHGHAGGFNGKGRYTIVSRSHFQGMNRLVGEGSFEIEMAFDNIKFNPRGDTASPGITIWVKDAMMRRLHFYIRQDRIDMGLADEEAPAPFPKGPRFMGYPVPPDSAKVRLTYDEDARRIRIYYGINGAEAVTELPQSASGLYFGKPLRESTALYIMMSNGQVDVDHFSIRPVE